MRHGEYDPNTMSLSAHGELEAYNTTMKLVKKYSLIPDIILHSPIKRAIETAHKVNKTFNEATGRDITLIEINDLKENNPTDAYEFLKDVNNKNLVVLAITHSPNICGLSQDLGGQIIKAYTAEAIVYETNAENWQEAAYSSRFVKTIKPMAS